MSENPNDKAGVGEGSEAKTEQAPSRRRLLKALAGAGGVFAAGAFLPQKWTSPIVSRVIVPAHAQATAVITGSFSGGGGPSDGPSDNPAPGPKRAGGFGRRLLDALIPAANAAPGDGCVFDGGAFRTYWLNVCVNVQGGQVVITVYPCYGIAPVSGSGALSPDGSFNLNNVGGLSVSGELTPTGGEIGLSGVYPGFHESFDWTISVAAGGCSAGPPTCHECYLEDLGDPEEPDF